MGFLFFSSPSFLFPPPPDLTRARIAAEAEEEGNFLFLPPYTFLGGRKGCSVRAAAAFNNVALRRSRRRRRRRVLEVAVAAAADSQPPAARGGRTAKKN